MLDQMIGFSKLTSLAIVPGCFEQRAKIVHVWLQHAVRGAGEALLVTGRRDPMSLASLFRIEVRIVLSYLSLDKIFDHRLQTILAIASSLEQVLIQQDTERGTGLIGCHTDPGLGDLMNCLERHRLAIDGKGQQEFSLFLA